MNSQDSCICEHAEAFMCRAIGNRTKIFGTFCLFSSFGYISEMAWQHRQHCGNPLFLSPTAQISGEQAIICNLKTISQFQSASDLSALNHEMQCAAHWCTQVERAQIRIPRQKTRSRLVLSTFVGHGYQQCFDVLCVLQDPSKRDVRDGGDDAH